MNYGCDVSNRYTGYLDSSDHGNSMSSSMSKNKRKTKKKRKPKNQKLKVDKAVDTMENAESKDIAGVPEAQQSLPIDDKEDRNDDIESLHQVTLDSSIDGLSSLPSCGSPMQLDTSKDATEHDDNGNISNGIIDGIATKWSVICFEEEQNLMSHEVNDQHCDEQKFVDEPEMVFKDQRIYPTVYFYNSKFGNKNRRVVYNDSHDRNRRPQPNNDNESNNHINDEKPKKRRNRNGRNRQKNTSNDMNDNKKGDTTEIQSPDEIQNDSHNESADRASQQTGESNNREYSKNQYNKLKHGMPQRTFTRRRTDFVRNV